ncbi:MAG: response regulator [Blautia sp.]
MKVLVVDDQQHVYKAVQLLVNWELYDVTEVLYASNGSEALEIMERDAPELVFTDMQMPVMDGPHFLQELRNKGFESEVIAVSGYNDFAYVMSLLHASGVEYLLKPIDEEELNEAVSKAVNRIWEKEKEKKKPGRDRTDPKGAKLPENRGLVERNSEIQL